MLIRRFILSFSLMLQSLICSAQSESMVVVKSGVFIRDSTTINSNAVGSVKFGEMVAVLNEPSAKDVVNGMKGNWVKIKYNTYTGYVFDAYLGNFIKRDKNSLKIILSILDSTPRVEKSSILTVISIGTVFLTKLMYLRLR